MRNQRGITLVALVITIIVLLILAAVTIAALGGSNGILSNAGKAQIANEIGEVKDLVAIAVNEGISEYYNTIYVNGAAEVNGNNDLISTIDTKLDALVSQVTPTTLGITDNGTTISITITSQNGEGKSTSSVDATGTLDKWTDNFGE